MTGRRVGKLGIVVAALVAAAAPAATAGTPGYHSPGYAGTTAAPTTAPATLPPVALGTGNHPTVVVDAAGTAHIAWSSGDGDQADSIHYCRLPRGASACDATMLFRPEPPASASYNPAYNIDFDGPQLYIVGTQLVLIDNRTSTAGFTHPDGSPGDTTVVYTSEDGGTTWTGGLPVGTDDIGGTGVVFGTDLDPRIATINTLDTDGTMFQALSPAAFTSETANLGPSLAEGSGGSVAADADPSIPGGQVPVAAFHGPDADTIAVRRWSGTGDINNVATWGPETVFPGSDPQLAGGPGGLFLMDSELSQSPLSVHQIDGTTEQPGVQISDDDATEPFLSESPSGALYAAWTGDADHTDLEMNVEHNGVWSSPEGQPIETTSHSLNETWLSEAADGGGFALVHQDAGTDQDGPIVSVPYGTQAPTGQPGLGNLPGGSGDTTATTACTTVSFGAIVMHPAFGCFLHGTGSAAAVEVADGTISLNGLSIAPDAGSQIVIDAHQHTLNSTGPVTVSIPGGGATPDIVLWKGDLHVKIPNAGSGQTLFDFPTSGFPTAIDGFPVHDHTPVTISGSGVKVSVDITLPAGFGGNVGHADLTVGPSGLQLDSLKITIPDGTDLGFASLDGVTLTYDGATDTWTGDGTIDDDGLKLTVHISFKDGKFNGGSVTVAYFPGVPVYEPLDLWLYQVGLAVGVNPLTITGTATLGAVPLVEPDYLAKVVGTLQLQFSPFDVKMTADGYILNTQFDTATLEYTAGALSFAAHAGLEIDGFGIEGDVHALISKHQLAGSIQAGVCGFGKCLNAVDVSVSSHGAAYCFPFEIPTPLGSFHPSITHDWDSLIPIEPHFSCVHEDPAEANDDAEVPGAPLTFTVPAGVPSYDVEVDGTGGAPTIALTGPNGAPITLGTYGQSAAGAMTLGSSTFIGLASPAAGTYTIVPQASSTPIAGVETDRGYATPTVKPGTVSGRGRAYALHYAVEPVPGVTVQFTERTARGDTVIGTATGSRGTLRFSPAPGPGGRRAIVARAVVGTGTDQSAVDIGTVAHYVAPAPPKPTPAGAVTARIRRGQLVVRFHHGTDAARYLVTVHLPHRQTISRFVPSSAKGLTLGGLTAAPIGVTVTTVAADGRSARPAVGRVSRVGRAI